MSLVVISAVTFYSEMKSFIIKLYYIFGFACACVFCYYFWAEQEILDIRRYLTPIPRNYSTDETYKSNEAETSYVTVNLTRGGIHETRSILAVNFTQQKSYPTVKCLPRSNLPRIPMTSLQGNTLNKRSTYFSKNWGNVLSPYWAARTMAELGGYEYRGGVFGRGTWMEYLPTYAPARIPRAEIFQTVCRTCKNYEFFHGCPDGFGHLAQTIREDTRNAIYKHSKRVKKEENDQIFNFFQPTDWLIYNRAAIFIHGAHAPGVVRMFSVIPTTGRFNVFILIGRREDPFSLCSELVAESMKYIKKRNPEANVRIIKMSTLYVDFSRLVFAPNVIIAGTGSSFGMWSAIMANNNTVFVVGSPELSKKLPSSVSLFTDLPVIKSPAWSQEYAIKYGIPFGTFSNSSEHREAIFNYYRSAR